LPWALTTALRNYEHHLDQLIAAAGLAA